MTDPAADEHEPTSDDSPYIAEDSTWRASIRGTRAIFDIEGHPPWEAVITGTGSQANYNLAALRTRRHGGAHAADIAHHKALIDVLGAATLASGHIELEMKRILLTARGEPDAGLADVDKTWSQLEVELRELAQRETSPIAELLQPVLQWADKNRLRERRNALVHSAWCLYATGHFEGARTPFRSDGLTIFDDGRGLVATVELLWEYLAQLQTVVPWMVAVLPPLPDDVPVVQLRMDIEGG